MPYCWKCGAELPEDAKSCPVCGTSVALLVAEPERRRIRREERRPISTLTLALIGVVLIVVVVAAVWATTVFLPRFWPSAWPRVVGSGNLVTEEMNFSDFTIVEVGSAFDVEITRSSYSVSITVDDNIFDYIEASKTADTLTVRLKWGYSYQSVTLRAEITMPELYELELSGATHGTVVGFNSSHKLTLGLSGASSLNMGDMLVGDVEVQLSGASNLNGDLTASGDAKFALSGASSIELEGEANDLFISASGASLLELSDFPVHDANVNLSGASRATVNLDGRLDGDLSGASHLLYIGNPTTVDVNTSGGSTVGKK